MVERTVLEHGALEVDRSPGEAKPGSAPAYCTICVRFRSSTTTAENVWPTSSLPADNAISALHHALGADADTAWLPPEIALDRNGYVLTGLDVRAAERWELDRDPYLLETSVPGVFACGDVRFSQVKRVAAAVGEGSMAIAFVHQYLKDAPDRASVA